MRFARFIVYNHLTMTDFVVLDIETTGLDPQTEAITEIGAVRFNERRIEAEFSTLINPGRPIPPMISQLTGITDQMVRGAPPISQVLPDLVEFVGNVPVIGHNVRFDLAFLRKHRALIHNESIDTYELASVLLPGAGRYNLASLVKLLGVPYQSTHRALMDAKACYGIYQRLFELAQELPLPVLGEIVRLGESLDWDAFYTFRRALAARSRETLTARQAKSGALGPLFESYQERNLPPLTPGSEMTALYTDEVAAILEHGGLFSSVFPNYEFRTQQVEMLRAITESLNNNRHLLIEAGTGTGKSMAYLVPAALWAIQNKTRVVISTNTINLQDQLINKDIPDLRRALGVDLRAVVVKGRSNYLCPRRLESFRRHGPQNAEEMRVFAKILVWMQTSTSGDRVEINLNSPAEREIWSRLSADDDGCTTENCLGRAGGSCPFFRVRQSAQSAHILIVNHALLLADIATGSRVLPEYEYLIIDEAHHIEEATTSALGFSTSQPAIEQMLRELGGANAGGLGRLMDSLQGALLPADYASLQNFVNQTSDNAYHFQDSVRNFFQAINDFLSEQREGNSVGMYAHQERILPATRTIPAWMEVEVTWEECENPFKAMLESLTKILMGLGEIQEQLSEDVQETINYLNGLYRRFAELMQALNGMVFQPRQDTIYWVEISSGGKRIALNTAPLHVGPLMQKHLWNEKSAVIMTSATLTTAGDFNYIRGRLNAEDAYELTLGSPFDYENAAMVYIANDVPEPSDRNGHQKALEQAIINLAQATGGRMLVLFTSYDQLKRTAQSIQHLLTRANIRLYEQGDGASAHALIESFRADDRAVLLGTRAFWEGVDLPGDALQAIVIAKIPFDVPSDPIIAARSETFEDPFTEYSLPEAILRFRQGFGRLIRTRSDRGIVAILDRRIMTKRYGKLFLSSLPEVTTRIGPLADLSRSAKQWLNL